MTDPSYSMQANAEFQKHGRMDVRPSQTQIIVVSGKESFRRMARTLPAADDRVLEIGCSTGEATRALVTTGAQVFAVDKSTTLVEQLQADLAEHEQVVVACLDGRNIPGLAALVSDPTILFIDVGGDAQLDIVALQLRLCLRAFRPHTVVVRNFELATLSSLVVQVEPPQLSGLSPAEGPVGHDVLGNLLDLSKSTSSDTRCFAANRLGTMSDDEAQSRLQEMLEDPHQRVRRAAELAGQRDVLADSLSGGG
ncbi:MAG: methyltransferase domain-containing protein [Gemmatimonadetes bacterium]|nr:methyltransferase domain-containing protein [Gemmatimonadota bacterium]MBT6145839.1 methyltransferase domain-containing protein [Gemmatimonadota bacterium]MBT7862905.1 methyltransferase domain-containing protein [Gemmatimonadota bacterium]